MLTPDGHSVEPVSDSGSPSVSGPPESVTGDAAFQTDVLDEMTQAVNYRRWLVSLATPHLGDDALEIGSGNGDYVADWAPGGGTITATEGYPALVSRLAERFADVANVEVRSLMLPADEPGSYSSVVAYNVLEHIPDDRAAVRSVYRLLRPGGRAVLFVPAFNALMSDYDLAVGHQRRYRRAGLRRLLVEAGFDVEVLHYVNLVGFFGWLLTVRLLRGRPKDGALLRAYDRFVVPVQQRLERRWPPPFGQSLFVVARRPG